MSTTHSFNCPRQLGVIAITLAAAFANPMGQALAQSGTSSTMKSLDEADRKFIDTAAQGGMAEVAMGQLAQQRGSSAQVKAFGERMVTDHGKANDELKRVAGAKGVQLPAVLSAAHQQHANTLAQLSGAEFDRTYMKHMVDDHKKDVSDFDKASKSAKDPGVKDFAARTLPTLQSHLQLAKTTYDAVKK